MALVEYLCNETICMDLQPSKRDATIRVLLELLVAAGKLPGAEFDAAVEVLLAREKLGSTAIGNGIAVPHARMDGLDGVVISLGLSRAGVEFSALDGLPTYQIFLVMASPDHNEEYLDAMSHISRLVQDEDFRRFLSQAKDGHAVMALIEEMDT